MQVEPARTSAQICKTMSFACSVQFLYVEKELIVPFLGKVSSFCVIIRGIISVKSVCTMEDEENTIRMRQDDFFLMLKGKIKGTRQLPDSLFGAVDEIKSEPEVPASVACLSMNFTRCSSEK